MNDLSKIIFYFEKHKPIAIVIHEHPDGDCLGSALALGLVLQKYGYKVNVFYPESIPQIYRFLPGQEMIKGYREKYLPEGIGVIAVDCADLTRIAYKIPAHSKLINIDHHISNTLFGDINMVDPQAAAAGEILYELFSKESTEIITPDVATCLYVAISTDTGSFRFSNTTPKTLRIAAELLSAKADVDLIRANIYERRPYQEIIALKKALHNMARTENNLIVWSTLSYSELLEDNLGDTDTNGLINLMLSIEGIEAAFLFKEIEPDCIKVSLRSKGCLDVNTLAAEYSGGGHFRAAGCTLHGNLTRTVNMLVNSACQSLKGRELIGRGN